MTSASDAASGALDALAQADSKQVAYILAPNQRAMLVPGAGVPLVPVFYYLAARTSPKS